MGGERRAGGGARRRPRRACRGALAVAAGFSFAAGAAPLPHPGPPIWLEMVLRDDAVALTVRGEPEPLRACLDLGPELVGPLPAATVDAIRADAARLFAEHHPVRVDGERVRPRLESLDLPEDTPDEDGWLFVEIALVYPCDAPPRRVSLLWESFEGTSYLGESYIPITVRRGTELAVVSVWPEEPEYVWHAPEHALPGPPPAPIGPLVGVGDGALRLPVLSLAALGVGAVAFAVLRRRRPAAAWGSAAAGLALAWLLQDAAALDVPRPGPSGPPGRERARAIFDTLHANVYRAFDARTEEEIYGYLAASVHESILDDLYGDVYESLVLREEGGAVCTIERVEVVERTVFLPEDEDAPHFDVDATWDVFGIVAHWGHVHRRRSRYHAVHTVRHDGESWKIAEVRVLAHERIDELDEGK